MMDKDAGIKAVQLAAAGTLAMKTEERRLAGLVQGVIPLRFPLPWAVPRPSLGCTCTLGNRRRVLCGYAPASFIRLPKGDTLLHTVKARHARPTVGSRWCEPCNASYCPYPDFFTLLFCAESQSLRSCADLALRNLAPDAVLSISHSCLVHGPLSHLASQFRRWPSRFLRRIRLRPRREGLAPVFLSPDF